MDEPAVDEPAMDQLVRVHLMTAWRWAVRAGRLMIGIPDYDTYVAHCRAHHPDEPVMTYVEFFRDRERARFACEKGRFKGCC